MKKMTFEELTEMFRNYNRDKDESMTDRIGYIVYRKDNWKKPYSLKARTYRVSSASAWFQPDKMGRCLTGDSMDDYDIGARLDVFFGKWKVDYCYIREEVDR